MPTYNKAVINGTTYIDLSGDTVAAGSMLSGTTAHDKNGASVTGSIATMTLPASASSSATSGYTGIGAFPVATSNRFLNIDSGYLASPGYYQIRGVRTSGISAANIKDGAVVQVGDTASTTRLLNVTGTFTDASTVSSGQTAAAAGQILSGYSAWVDGAEVQGSVGGATVRIAGSSITSAPSYSFNSSTGVVSMYNGNAAQTQGIQFTPHYQITASGYIAGGTDTTTSGTITVETQEVKGSTTYQVPLMTLPTAAGSSGAGTTKATVTPGTSDQYINIPTGYNASAANYKVEGDANLIAGNIADGVEIFGVTGTHSGGGPTCTLASGGVSWATCCTFPSSGAGWREEKYSDGRLIRWVWDWFTMSSAGRSSAISTTGATAFVGTPTFSVGFRDNGSHACKGSVSAWSNTSVTVYMYENSYGGKSAVCVRMEGFWQ